MTIPTGTASGAAIRTTRGLMVSPTGAPASVYVDGDYSITVLDRNFALVYSAVSIEAKDAGGAFPSRAAAIASEIPVGVKSIRVLSGGVELSYLEDLTGTALSTNGGARNWSPAGLAMPQHWGAIPDGADTGSAFTGTDNTAAFQAAMNWSNTKRAEIFTPFGKYRFAHQSLSNTGYITCPGDWYCLTGARGAELLIDENTTYYNGTGGGGTELVFLFDTGVSSDGNRKAHSRFHVSNITIRGRWSHVPGKTGLGGFRVEGFESVTFDAVEAYDIRNKFTRCRHNHSFRVISTRAARCARGMWRSQETSNVLCTGNWIEDGDDDTIDFHSSDNFAANRPARSSIIVTDNILVNSEGILALGAKHTVVSNNLLFRCHGTQIAVGSGLHPEGNTTTLAVTVEGNVILDPLERYSGGVLGTSSLTQGAIYIGGTTRSSASTSGVVPGEYSAPLAAFLMPWTRGGTTPSWGAMWTGDVNNEGSDPSVYSGAAGMLYSVKGNIVARTLPDVPAFSNWGFGLYYDGAAGYVDPAVADNNFKAHACILLGDMTDFVISGNVFFGLPEAGVYFRGATGSDRKTAFRNGVISDNVFRHLKGGLMKDGDGGSVAFADWDDWTVTVSGNTFDIDPYHKASFRTAPLNGSWQSDTSSAFRGAYMRNCKGMTFKDNDFSNCYKAIQGNTDEFAQFAIEGNVLRCLPVALGFSTSNLGIATVERAGGAFDYIITDSNPTLANYGKVLNTCVPQAVSIPTAGVYVAGHYVRNSAPAVASSKTLLGWLRLTTGSGHTAASTGPAGDWAPMFATTS